MCLKECLFITPDNHLFWRIKFLFSYVIKFPFNMLFIDHMLDSWQFHLKPQIIAELLNIPLHVEEIIIGKIRSKKVINEFEMNLRVLIQILLVCRRLFATCSPTIFFGLAHIVHHPEAYDDRLYTMIHTACLLQILAIFIIAVTSMKRENSTLI